MSAAIFSGGYAKILANLGIKLKDDTRILSGSVDPSVTNPSAPDGSIYLSSGFGLFVRKSSTWLKLASSDELVNSLLIQTFEEAALADFTQTGLELIASPFIHGKKTARLIHQAASDYSFKQVKPVDPKFRGKSNTFRMDCRSTAESANVTVLIKDETNNTTLISGTFTTGRITAAVFNTNSNTTVNVTDNAILNSLKVGASISGAGIPTGTTITAIDSSLGTITISNAATATATGVSLKVSALPNVQSYAFDIPTNCSSISYTVTALQEAGSPETYVDDIVIELTDMAMTSTSVTVPKNNNYSGAIQNGITIGATTTAPTKGTTAVDRIVHSRVENKLIAEYQYKQSTAVSAGSGDYIISLPSGVSFDTSVITPYTGSLSASADFSASLVGYGQVSNGAATTTQGMFRAVAYSATSFRLVGMSSVIGTNGTLGHYPFGSTWLGLDQPALAFNVHLDAPIANWKTNETETKTIPLSSSVIVTEPDSQMTWQGYAGLGSTRTRIPYFTNARTMKGSAISYTSSTANGLEVTVLEDGYYDIHFSTVNNINQNVGVGIGLNLTDFTTDILSRTTDTTVLRMSYPQSNTSTRDSTQVSWSGPLKAGDKLYPMLSSAIADMAQYDYFSVSKVGSTKILNPSSDQKVEIPTHELRFEGASARGSVATAIVKFDTLAKIKGDGFEVINTAADGTVVTIKKAGILNVNATLYYTVLGTFSVTLNQSTLTALPTISSEIYGSETIDSSTPRGNISTSIPVNVGDKIRVSSNQTPSSDHFQSLQMVLQETSVAVALQNVAPRWDDSDSAVRVQGGNGFGSTNTSIRRYSNVLENVGTAVEYVGSATLGDSFLIKETGLYSVSATDAATTASSFFITKNSLVNSPTTNIALETMASSGIANASVEVYLQKGDVIRFVAENPANMVSAYTNSQFSITKVGKTQGTVDVTPFVQIPQNEVEAIEALNTTSTFGSTNTGVPVLNITKNTNKGIIQVLSSAAEGTSFKVLKDCELQISVAFQSSVANGSTGFITKNSTALTAAAPNGIVFQTVASSISVNNMSTNIIVSTGDVIRFQRDSTNLNNVNFVTITATALSPSIATPTEQVSSDTIPFVFKATAITDSDPVGTFNTYTYAAGTNIATISATAPTQTTSSMNVNGVQVFARAYGSAGASTLPSRFDIKIGKGLKAKQVDAYASLAKTTSLNVDSYTLGSVTDIGTTVAYNEITGILTLEAGVTTSSGITNHFVGSDIIGNGATSGYFVFNASKSPSLVSIPNLQQRVAYLSDVQATGVNGGSSTASTWSARVLNTLNDPSGIVSSLASNQFTLPQGTYDIFAVSPFYNGGNAKIRMRNITDGTTPLTGDGGFSNTNGSTKSIINGVIAVNSPKTFEIQYFCATAQASSGLGGAVGGGEPEVYTQVKITKIK